MTTPLPPLWIQLLPSGLLFCIGLGIRTRLGLIIVFATLGYVLIEYGSLLIGLPYLAFAGGMLTSRVLWYFIGSYAQRAKDTMRECLT